MAHRPLPYLANQMQQHCLISPSFLIYMYLLHRFPSCRAPPPGTPAGRRNRNRRVKKKGVRSTLLFGVHSTLLSGVHTACPGCLLTPLPRHLPVFPFSSHQKQERMQMVAMVTATAMEH